MPTSFVVLIAMTVVVAILAVYRKLVASHEDDFVHLAEGATQLIADQEKTAQTLAVVDRIGVALTVATAVYGVSLLAQYLYQSLIDPTGF